MLKINIIAKLLEGLNIIARYSYNDMCFPKTSGIKGSFLVGDRLARTPTNTANLPFFYTLPPGISKGVSVRALGNYIGKRVGGWNNQIDQYLPNGIYDREIPLKGKPQLM